MKRLLALWMACLLVPVSALAAQLRGYQKGEGYQYIQLGSYPQGASGEVQPLLWRVLDVTDGQALLLTEDVLDAQQVIMESDAAVIAARSYRRIDDYAQSDLNTWMNQTMLPTMAGDSGLASALVSGVFGKLYPLTDAQYLNPAYGFSTARYGESKTRFAKVTPYADARGVYHDRLGNAPYWVATVKAADDYKLQIVGYNGHLSYGAYTRVNIGVRPAALLALEQCEITGGSGTRADPFTVRIVGHGSVAAAGAAAARQADHPADTEVAANARRTAASEGAASSPTLAADAASNAKQAADGQATSSDAGDANAVPPVLARDASPVTLSLLGDVSIGDAFQYRGRASSLTSAILEHGMAWVFARVSGVLQADALTAANLEVCLTESKNKSGKVFPLVAPPSFTEVLTTGGVDVVNTVNNHSFDFGTAGYADTLAALDQAAIGHFGSIVDGRGNISGQTLIVERGGIRFGFAGYSYPQSETLAAMQTQIQALRDEGCDIVIVSLHWGRETYMTPKSGQPAYAAKIIDLGADVIWGHHPHVLQPVQFYKGKPILFSTGNFIFGTMSKVEPATGIFQLHYRKTPEGVVLDSFQVVPCMTQRAPEYQPYPVEDAAQQARIWGFLRTNKAYDGYENLPESFLQSGVVRFSADGAMLAQ